VLSVIATDAGIATIAFVAWRAVLGAIILVGSVGLAIRLVLLRRVRLADVPARHWLQVSALAGLNVFINLTVFSGFEYASIALVLICFYTYPVIVAVAATRVYGEPLTGSRIAALSLASVGLILVVAAPMLGGDAAQVGLMGLLLGLLGAVGQAAHSLIAARGYSSLPAPHAAAALSVIQAIGFVVVAVLLGAGPALRQPFEVSGAWVPIVLGATIGLAIPTAAVLAGMRRLGPTRGSILMLLEPIVGVALAAVLLGQQPAPVQLLGGVLVLAGSLLAQVQRRGQDTPEVAPAHAEPLPEAPLLP
jgi:drug/metabolite transporter (DMT)-like permease